MKRYFSMLFSSTLFSLCLAGLLGVTPAAHSLVKMDPQSIELALKYGMQNQGNGYKNLLGYNWMEGPNGELLNIYTPFMLLASKTYKGGFPENPTKADLKKAKTQFARVIRDINDTHNPLEIKFSVALYGNTPGFAGQYSAHVQGFGRGKEFNLKTYREIRQKVATKDPQANAHPYEAINAYYFKFEDLAVLDEYSFILDTPEGQQVTFKIRNDKIY